jgi:hypothetical protein
VRAEPPASANVSLQWVRGAGAEACVDGRVLAERVETKLGRPVFAAAREAAWLVEGRVERTAAGFQATLRSYDDQGELLGSREVVSTQARCDELSETVAVVLAVMLDPEAGGPLSERPAPQAPQAAQPQAEPAPCPTAPPAQVDSPAAPPEPPARQRTRFEVSAFGRGAYGHLPSLAGGAGVAFEAAFRRFGGARLEGVAFAEREVALEAVPGAGTRVRVLYAGAQYCPLWRDHARLRISACAGLSGGALQHRGFGLAPGRADSLSPLLNATAGARVSLQLVRSLRLQVGTNLSVPLMRTLFEARLQDGTRAELFEQRAFAVELDVGLGSTF